MQLKLNMPETLDIKQISSKKMLEAWVLYLYNNHKISSGKLRKLLKLNIEQMGKFLKKNHARPFYDENSYKQDMKAINTLFS